jgi:hypothetical protein
MKIREILFSLFVVFVVSLSTSSSSLALDQFTVDRVNDLRTIQSTKDQEKIAGYNKKMDAAWKYFSHNKKVAIPSLQQILIAETALASPNQLVLLDIAHFLAREGGTESVAASLEALYRINPASPIIQDNFQDLFHLAYRLANERDPRTLKAFDRIFLGGNGSVFVPQHAMTLDSTLICVFLYGKYGADALPHLLNLLNEPQHRLRILEILIWLGKAESVPKIQLVMNAHRDYDTFTRLTAFMMQVGGKAGREAMLALKVDELDTASKSYYSKVVSAIRDTNYRRMEKSFAAIPNYKTIDDAALTIRFKKMYDTYGKDDDLHPLVILKSGLSEKVLIAELTGIRDRMFYRLSNEALTDVKTTNAIINALSYRGR